MAELKYEIKEYIGVLSENAKGWKKELNLVSWSEHAPKYDIREWNEDHTRMGKGVTLSQEEFDNLRKLMLGEPVDLGGDDVDEAEILGRLPYEKGEGKTPSEFDSFDEFGSEGEDGFGYPPDGGQDGAAEI